MKKDPPTTLDWSRFQSEDNGSTPGSILNRPTDCGATEAMFEPFDPTARVIVNNLKLEC